MTLVTLRRRPSLPRRCARLSRPNLTATPTARSAPLARVSRPFRWCAAAGTPRDYAIRQVFLQAGIRVSELACLSIDDVDLERGLLRVTGKGMADRDIPLNKKAIAALKLWRAARPPTEYRMPFTNRFGEPLGVRSVQKLVERHRRGAGIEKRITPHSLRHAFATHTVRQGVNAFQLRDYLGHATVATTELDVYLSQDEARKVMEQTSL